MNLSIPINYCVVGLGRHSKTKIMPALISSRHKILGVVTSQKIESKEYGSIYRSISEALKNLPPDTVFIIATPPKVHFNQSKELLLAGRNVIVEKPAFILASEAKELAILSTLNNLFLVENLMYRKNVVYNKLINYWKINHNHIIKIKIVFLVPEFPADTFRQEDPVPISILYDIGCYPISILYDLNLPLDTLKIFYRDNSIHIRDEVVIEDNSNRVEISIHVGVSSNYDNYVEIESSNGETCRFWPFFYGRSCKSYITTINNNEPIITDTFEERDSFQSMFDISKEQWLVDQDVRSNQIISVTTVLEKLCSDLQHI